MKADILTFDDGKPDGFSVHRRIERGAVGAIARSCPGKALTGTKSRTAKANATVGKRRRPASGMLESGTPSFKSGFAGSFIFPSLRPISSYA